jgi:integrase
MHDPLYGPAEREQHSILVIRALDLFIGELARRGRSPATRRTYFKQLCDFCDTLPRDFDTQSLRRSHYEYHLDRWQDSAPSTLASNVSICRSFSRYLYEFGYAERDWARDIPRPRRLRPEDVDVVSVSASDVTRMLDACSDWQELLCISTAVFLGARRAALAHVRRRDADLERGTIRFSEKGGKVISKPMPDEYVEILRAAEAAHVWPGPDAYLIPNRRPGIVRRKERSDKIIWTTVKAVAERAGVHSHVHALRAAFAVHFDEAHPDRLHALKELMGHSRIETTLIYLRRKNRARDMEAVRDLSWTSSVFSSSPLEAHTGFEPVPSEVGETVPERPHPALPGPLARKLEELRERDVCVSRR